MHADHASSSFRQSAVTWRSAIVLLLLAGCPAIGLHAQTYPTIEETILQPLAMMRDRGEVECTDFTALVQTWKTRFGARAFLYDAKNPPPRRRAVRK